MKPSRALLALVALSAVLSSCGLTEAFKSDSTPARVDWRWPVKTTYVTTPVRGDKFFLAVEDFEEDADIFAGLQNGLVSKFQEYGLEQVTTPQEADYSCYVYIRYFNTNPKPDKGEAVLVKADKILGGQKGWWTREGEIDEPPQIREIPPMGPGPEWDLLIDIAVGEKAEGDRVELRTGRLLGYWRGSREEAIWMLRKGVTPPRPPAVAEGQPVPPPARPDPPDHLIDTLSKGILRIP